MAENFNFGTMIQTSQAMSDNSVVEKYCYNNEPEKCQIYGGLYQWQEIMQYTEQQGTQGICPPGWHLSANGEWTTLINFLGGNSIAGGKMKEIGTLHWSPPNTGATDESGFTGLPGGFASDFMGEYASFWCSTQLSSNVSCSNFLEYDKIGVTRLGYPNYYGLSLRCIKNQAPFQPMNPIPPNEGLNQSINTIISWSCYHPNFCPMTYDIYFGTINPPELFSSEQNDTTYNPGILLSNTQYFWKIIAHDIYGNNSEGPVWSFTTYQNWTCGYPLVIEHTAGDEAPVNKTVTYGTVETNLSGSNKCWITQNLGASNQATSVTDGTESSRGWYWQFNRKQGYKHDGTIVTPSWTITSIIENYDWLAINDPCSLLLGVGWRLPTYSEWSNVLNNGGWGGAYDAFASVLKLHIAGDIGSNNGALYDVGNYGYYWSGNQSNTVNGGTMSIHAYYNSMGAFFKADGFSVRCLKD